jgi:hypothetical protein
MPRPVSELTKNGKSITVRLTKSEYEEYIRLGAVKWFRETLRKSLEKK